MTEALKTCTGKTPFPFMNYKWIFIVISLFCVGLGINEVAIKGINFGVDFKGGIKVLYEFKEAVTAEEIRKSFADLGLGDVQVIAFGADTKASQFMVRAKYNEGKNVTELLNNQAKTVFGAGNVTVMSSEEVGPKVGEDLRKKGFMAVGLSCLLILVYIGFRFDFLFSPGAIVALAHDLIISIGFFAYFGKEFNLPILAALLTILGYSINDTIVIYDRIRENIGRLPKHTSALEVINISVTETLGRTLVTSLTVLFVVVTLFYLGGGVLHDFAFCLIIGTIFGTYSSIFIASPMYLFLHKMFPGKGIKADEPVKVAA